jgi:hypothetical protein
MVTRDFEFGLAIEPGWMKPAATSRRKRTIWLRLPELIFSGFTRIAGHIAVLEHQRSERYKS